MDLDLSQFQWHLRAHLNLACADHYDKKESALFALFLIFFLRLGLFPIIGLLEARRNTHIDDDIFEICTGSVSFLFKILGNIL